MRSDISRSYTVVVLNAMHLKLPNEILIYNIEFLNQNSEILTFPLVCRRLECLLDYPLGSAR